MLPDSKITADYGENTTKAYVFDDTELLATMAVEFDRCPQIPPSGPVHVGHLTIIAGT
jgi:hypothetical protein